MYRRLSPRVLNRRSLSFASLNFKSEFENIVGIGNVLSNLEDIERFTHDWTNSYEGGEMVIFPKSTQEVSKVLSFCTSKNINVIPQGGNTGLVGGAVGLHNRQNQIILSLAKMNKILGLDEFSGIIECEAGCILDNINQEAGKKNYIVPLDLGAKGSCMIGGNIATNAGGLRFIQYGSLHRSVLGLELVLSDGTVLNMMRPHFKDNCGYHLKNLIIGSEGTLGVITKLFLSLRPKPRSIKCLFAKVER